MAEITSPNETLRESMYEKYLHSPAWQRKRWAVLERAASLCEARMEGCTGKAVQVHHLNYAHVGNEPLWELRAVCRNCHEALSAG